MPVNDSDAALGDAEIVGEHVDQRVIGSAALRRGVNRDLIFGLGNLCDSRLPRVGFDRHGNSPRHGTP